MRRMPVVRGTAAVMAFLTLTTVSASTLMFTYSGAINKALNINTSKIVETDDQRGLVRRRQHPPHPVRRP